MSLKDRFRKLLGDNRVEPPADGWENLARAVVRNGNLDWRGLPIDRNRDGETPVTLERPRGFSELFNGFLGRSGARIEQRWNPEIPTLHQNPFQRDSATTETARERAMGAPRIANNSDFLRNGGRFRSED
jgi:hypothetical protein